MLTDVRILNIERLSNGELVVDLYGGPNNVFGTLTLTEATDRDECVMAAWCADSTPVSVEETRGRAVIKAQR